MVGDTSRELLGPPKNRVRTDRTLFVYRRSKGSESGKELDRKLSRVPEKQGKRERERNSSIDKGKEFWSFTGRNGPGAKQTAHPDQDLLHTDRKRTGRGNEKAPLPILAVGLNF